MKMGPVVAALDRRGFDQTLVHTGQHYDHALSQVFFDELGLRAPDQFLEVGSGTHTEQSARVMERLEPVLTAEQPDLVLVPGDVNSTLAAALAAAQMPIPVGHVEAGLRSFDRTMPEELNRTLTDFASDLLFIHSLDARENLRREGHADDQIHFVGNTMIDTLVAMQPQIDAAGAARRHGCEPGAYLLVTLHRPALVDGPLLAAAIEQLRAIADQMPVLFPVHPRTRAAVTAMDIDPGAVQLLDPLGYVDFMGLVADAATVLTDSGGVQEETTYLGVPCFTLRDNTERPVTVALGTNTMLGLDPARIAEIPQLLAAPRRGGEIPPLWDGQAAERIADVLSQVSIRRRN
jgi:UDP-N-acetylglucosamine 2-epimerase (non-hydrolysing)